MKFRVVTDHENRKGRFEMAFAALILRLHRSDLKTSYYESKNIQSNLLIKDCLGPDKFVRY